MDTPGYEGWVNWHTWNAYNWLTSDEETYVQARKCNSTFELEGLWDSYFKNTDGIDTDEIDFCQIMQSFE